MEIYTDIDQQSPEWFALRIGSIGGSSISTAVAGGQGKIRNRLLYDLVGEILSGEKKGGYTNHEMQEGIKYEPEARQLYEFLYDVEVRQVALVKMSEHKHCSPDGLLDHDGMIEIKTLTPSRFVEVKATGIIETAYRKQMQWGMLICERQWCDYACYSPYVARKVHPLHVIRVKRDDKEIKELDEGANVFIEELQSLLIKVMKGG